MVVEKDQSVEVSPPHCHNCAGRARFYGMTDMEKFQVIEEMLNGIEFVDESVFRIVLSETLISHPTRTVRLAASEFVRTGVVELGMLQGLCSVLWESSDQT